MRTMGFFRKDEMKDIEKEMKRQDSAIKQAEAKQERLIELGEKLQERLDAELEAERVRIANDVKRVKIANPGEALALEKQVKKKDEPMVFGDETTKRRIKR